MELTVLGCSGSYGAPAGGACSGYLAAPGDTSIWIDCGNGTFANLQEHVDVEDLTAVVHHPRPPRPLRRHLRPARVPALRPRAARACRCTRPKGSRSTSLALVGDWGDTFDWRAVGDGDTATVGDVDAAVLAHRPPAAHVRGRGRARRPAPGLHRRHRAGVDASARSAPGADLVLSEATYLHDDIPAPIHLSASRPARRRARRRRARLDAHPPLADDSTRQPAVEEGSEAFGDGVTLAAQASSPPSDAGLVRSRRSDAREIAVAHPT